MALIPGTLPSDTCYGTPQDLLELFAQYLDVPALALNSKVFFSDSSPSVSDAIWFDTTNDPNVIFKINIGGNWLDYISNYVKEAVASAVTIASNDYVLISDTSDSGNAKMALVSGIAGKVVQIVEGSTTTSVTSTSASFVDTGLTVTITPTSASNKVLILISQDVDVYRAQSSQGAFFKVLRGATALYTGTTNFFISVGNSTTTQLESTWDFHYLDSPATTSATTYKVQGQILYTADSGQIEFQSASSRSSILAIEVTP